MYIKYRLLFKTLQMQSFNSIFQLYYLCIIYTKIFTYKASKGYIRFISSTEDNISAIYTYYSCPLTFKRQI
jgi:hypothetical protein